MKKIGIICEYNPLHNGHLYHFNKIKEKYPDSLVICILSSEFTERGELTVFNKFIRTKEALDLGIDLVLSNPIYYSMNNASSFAYSNVYYLNLCNVDTIICGQESDDPLLFKNMYKLEETKAFKNQINKYLNDGLSFKNSYLKAFEDFKIKFKSNDLLAFFYYKAIMKINKNIRLETIKRINNNYKDLTLNETKIQSATALRIQKDIKNYVPAYVYKDFKEYGFRDVNKLSDLIIYSFLSGNHNRENAEGLLNKADELNSKMLYKDILNVFKSKRYSDSKINRFIISNLLNIKDNFEINSNYIRVIGFNKKGQTLLADIKKDITIYTSIKNGINKKFDLELKADKILDIIYNEHLLIQDIKGPIIK
jgi:predicted nucleotidyltransferase